MPNVLERGQGLLVLCMMATSFVEPDSVLTADRRKYRLIRHCWASERRSSCGHVVTRSQALIQRQRVGDGRAEPSRPPANYRRARNEPIISV